MREQILDTRKYKALIISFIKDQPVIIKDIIYKQKWKQSSI